MPVASPITCTSASERPGCSWISTPSIRVPTSSGYCESSLQETAALLVVIGPRWTSLRDAAGMRRLDSPNDFVRLEVEAALGRNIPVVPVLVQGAAMPRAEDLPASLAPLAHRQAVGLDHAEFHDDAERLCDRLESAIAGKIPTSQSVVRKWWPAAAIVAAVAIGLIGYIAMRPSGGERSDRRRRT